jgi:ribosomal protein S18 acetylase RimI-like enzyme
MELLLREMIRGDREAVEAIHKRCLPVRYTKRFFDNVVRHVMQRNAQSPEEPVFTQVAIARERDGAPCACGYGCGPDASGAPECSDLRCEGGVMVGLVTAQLTPLQRCNANEDLSVSDPRTFPDALYILTICTISSHRRLGLGRTLLDKCLELASRQPTCGVVYLHVITHNDAAIQFYEKNGFTRLREMEGYYVIDGISYNCYLYARYVNGARVAPQRRGWGDSAAKLLRDMFALFHHVFGSHQQAREPQRQAAAESCKTLLV